MDRTSDSEGPTSFSSILLDLLSEVQMEFEGTSTEMCVVANKKIYGQLED